MIKKIAGLGKSKTSKSEEDLSLDQDLIYDCKIVYLTVLSSLDERISSEEELTQMLQYAGKNPSTKSVAKHWNKKTGYLTFQQFCEIVHKEPSTRRDKLLDAFRKIDVNGDGYLSHDELLKLLTTRGEPMSRREVMQVVNDADYNGDGRLDYQEFCNLMMSTISKCKEKHGHNTSAKGSSSYLSRMSSRRNDDRDDDEESDRFSDSPPRSISSKMPRKKDAKPKHQQQQQQREPLVEPNDLTRWNFRSFKGFICCDDDAVKAQQYHIEVTRDTMTWIAIGSVKPKYGQFEDAVLQSDLTAIIVDGDNKNRVVDFTSTVIDGKSCLKCNLKVGRYSILVFSSGATLKHLASSSKASKRNKSLQPKLTKGDGENMKLSRICRDALLEVFYRCDTNGDGYLNRSEFNQFQLQTSGEECDDDAWDVVKENFEMNNHMELTPEGFINLNLLEAKDPDGNGAADLWVTLETMGYSESLVLSKACPYQLEVFTNRCDINATVEAVTDIGHLYHDAILQCILAATLDEGMAVDGNQDVRLFAWKTPMRTTLAVKNITLSPLRVRLDCTDSINAITSRNSLDATVDVRPQKFQVAHHLVALDEKKSMKMQCQAMVVN